MQQHPLSLGFSYKRTKLKYSPIILYIFKTCWTNLWVKVYWLVGPFSQSEVNINQLDEQEDKVSGNYDPIALRKTKTGQAGYGKLT